MEKDVSGFYERLKSTWIKRHLKKNEFAEKLGLPVVTITNWSARKSLPNPDILLQICEFLNVSPYYLLYGEEEKEVTFDLTNFNKLTDEQKNVVNQLIFILSTDGNKD